MLRIISKGMENKMASTVIPLHKMASFGIHSSGGCNLKKDIAEQQKLQRRAIKRIIAEVSTSFAMRTKSDINVTLSDWAMLLPCTSLFWGNVADLLANQEAGTRATINGLK